MEYQLLINKPTSKKQCLDCLRGILLKTLYRTENGTEKIKSMSKPFIDLLKIMQYEIWKDL